MSDPVAEAQAVLISQLKAMGNPNVPHWKVGILAEDVGPKAATYIERQSAALAARDERIRVLEEALGWFVADERFQVAVGGNPNVVERMIADAQARYIGGTSHE